MPEWPATIVPLLVMPPTKVETWTIMPLPATEIMPLLATLPRKLATASTKMPTLPAEIVPLLVM